MFLFPPAVGTGKAKQEEMSCPIGKGSSQGLSGLVKAGSAFRDLGMGFRFRFYSSSYFSAVELFPFTMLVRAQLNKHQGAVSCPSLPRAAPGCVMLAGRLLFVLVQLGCQERCALPALPWGALATAPSPHWKRNGAAPGARRGLGEEKCVGKGAKGQNPGHLGQVEQGVSLGKAHPYWDVSFFC